MIDYFYSIFIISRLLSLVHGQQFPQLNLSQFPQSNILKAPCIYTGDMRLIDRRAEDGNNMIYKSHIKEVNFQAGGTYIHSVNDTMISICQRNHGKIYKLI